MGIEIKRLLTAVTDKLTGGPFGIFCLLVGSLYAFDQGNWSNVKTVGGLQAAITNDALLGIATAVGGGCIVISRFTTYSKIYSLAGLARLHTQNKISDSQFEAAKSMLFDQVSVGIVMDFLSEAEQTRPQDVTPEAIDALRRLAKSILKNK